MSKQVKSTVENTVSVAQENPPQKTKNLYIKVDTYDPAGKEIGTRIVDLFHYGTRGWIQDHNWWAMHNGHTVETRPADKGEVEEYLQAQTKILAEKYNSAA